MLPASTIGRPQGQASVDLSLDAVKRLTSESFGKPIVEKGKSFTARPGHLHYVDTSLGDVTAKLSDFLAGNRIGQSCTVYNASSNVVYVVPGAPKATINNWTCYPLLTRGAYATFVLVDKNKFACLGPVQKMNWPMFTRDSADASLVSATTPYPQDMSVRMDNGQILTSSSSLTCDLDTTGIGGRLAAESVTTGCWHIFAVPNGSRNFALTASKATDPTTAGYTLTGYTTQRYLWTIVVLATGPTAIETFRQAHEWYTVIDRDNSFTDLVTVSAATPTNNTWNQIDGTNLAGAGTTANVYTTVPTGIADMIWLNHAVTTASTTSQTGHVYCGMGTVASPPYALTTSIHSRSASVSTGSGTGYGSASDHSINDEISPIGTAGFVVSFQGFGATYNYRMSRRGFRNRFWGLD